LSFRRLEHHLGGTGVPLVTLTMTNSEAAVAGRLYKMTAGRPTKCTGTDTAIAYLCLEAVTAGTDVTATFEPILPGIVYEGSYTGTPAGGFVAGVLLADLDANGDNIDSADVTNGSITILSKDTTNTTARIAFNKNLYSQ
jgi:hypothetical protein